MPAPFRTPPGPHGHPLYGSLLEYRRDALDLFLGATRTHGDVVFLRIGPARVYLVNHPDHVQHVLGTHVLNYRKSASYHKLRALLGNGLITSDGQTWRRNRRLMQPSFHRERLGGLVETLTGCIVPLLARLDQAARDRQTVDVFAEMLLVTMDMVSRALFGADNRAQAAEVIAALNTGQDYVVGRLEALFTLPERFPSRGRRAFLSARRVLDDTVFRMIETRRKEKTGRGDILSMLLQAADAESGEALSDEDVRNEAMTIFLSGYETTATALAWTFYLLSRHPLARERMEAELDAVLGGQAPTVEHLPRLEYTRMVLQESMRLYPPVWSFSREAIEDDALDGVRIPAGSMVVVSPYCLHRHPGFWPNPEGFDPARFSEDAVRARPRYAYCPFGGGQRLCIGSNLAMMEMQLVLATVAQRFRLDLEPGHRVAIKAGITTKPSNGIRTQVVRREERCA